MANKFIWRWPYLDLWFDIWIISMATELMNVRAHDMTTTWIGLYIEFFHKWGFRFRLYSPWRRY